MQHYILQNYTEIFCNIEMSVLLLKEFHLVVQFTIISFEVKKKQNMMLKRLKRELSQHVNIFLDNISMTTDYKFI